jgi:uncharacterized membrane protein YebE (DUF533 family)
LAFGFKTADKADNPGLLIGVGGFANNNYWSSTENNNNKAWKQNFNNGKQNNNNKNNKYNVRAVRVFKQLIINA